MRGRWMAFAAGRAAGRNSVPEQTTQTTSQTNQADELEKLVEMHSEGKLTDEEFAKAKKKLLSG